MTGSSGYVMGPLGTKRCTNQACRVRDLSELRWGLSEMGRVAGKANQNRALGHNPGAVDTEEVEAC